MSSVNIHSLSPLTVSAQFLHRPQLPKLLERGPAPAPSRPPHYGRRGTCAGRAHALGSPLPGGGCVWQGSGGPSARGPPPPQAPNTGLSLLSGMGLPGL